MAVKELGINKKAYHDYEILDKYEAGISLLGTEIKSLRKGKVQLKESYVSFKDGEAFVKGTVSIMRRPGTVSCCYISQR